MTLNLLFCLMIRLAISMGSDVMTMQATPYIVDVVFRYIYRSLLYSKIFEFLLQASLTRSITTLNRYRPWTSRNYRMKLVSSRSPPQATTWIRQSSNLKRHSRHCPLIKLKRCSRVRTCWSPSCASRKPPFSPTWNFHLSLWWVLSNSHLIPTPITPNLASSWWSSKRIPIEQSSRSRTPILPSQWSTSTSRIRIMLRRCQHHYATSSIPDLIPTLPPTKPSSIPTWNKPDTWHASCKTLRLRG